MKYAHIPANISKIKAEIREILEQKGRAPHSCELVVVTKTRSMDEIKAVADSGHFLLGENRIQELSEKMEAFRDYPDLRWHMIGHLQSNKYKYIAGKAELIHSVDSLRLLNFLDSYCKKTGHVQDILLEFNVSGEESKYGFNTSDLRELEGLIPSKTCLRVKGLMTMAPYTADYNKIARVFRTLADISRSLEKLAFHGFNCQLSMGMSNDYRIAVEEGATIIRVGSKIFENN